MFRIISIILALSICGCAHAPQQLTLAHDIQVPKEWRTGSFGPYFREFSDIAGYISAYDEGWWWCVAQHSKDIDFQPACSDYFISGRAARTYGWPTGIQDAQARMDHLKRAYGKERVIEFLSEFKDVKLDEE